MPAKKFTSKIIAKEVISVHSATTKNGSPYEIFQVRATKLDGTQILWPDRPEEIPLRTFDANFPINEPVEVDAELFESEKYGDSYTLKVKNKPGGQTAKKVKGVEEELDKLRQRVARLEETVGEILRDDSRHRAQTELASAAPPPAAPPPPPPLPGDEQGGEQYGTFNPVSQNMSNAGRQSSDPPPF